MTGFSLVELTVAMVIGAVTILVLMGVLARFEGDKRGTTGGADAQNNGALALYGLQRDVRQGGYGIGWPGLFSCTMDLPSGGTVPMTPVVINPATSIIPAGDANTDTLLVIYGNANGEPQGNPITSQTGSSPTVYSVQMPDSFAVGDAVIAAPSVCAGDLVVGRITAVAATTVSAAAGTGATMYDLGSAPAVRAYAIRAGNLTVCDYMTTNCGIAQASLSASAWNAAWVPIANNVVSLRAQYGVDTSPVPMDAAVDTYDQTTPTTACGWARVRAVRLALAARNSQYNKTVVTSAAPDWEGSAGAAIDLSGASDWGHYRYQVFQSVVPIRNMVWLDVATLQQMGC